MTLTDEELIELHSIIFDRALYGDSEIVYGDGPEAVLTRTILGKLRDEIKARRI